MIEPDLDPRLPSRRPLLWPDWVLDLQEKLLQQDALPPTLIVGGAVRDALMHRPVKDIDLATSGDAIRLARLLTNLLDGDIFVMDAERGVARVFYQTSLGDRFTLDVAMFRGETLLDDLRGRDFTVNAIAVDLLGDLSKIIDPLGGERDIIDRILRRCEPSAIFDDPVRVLRAVRVSTQLNLRIEPQTLSDVRAAAPGITTSSPERIRDEFYSLLNLDRPERALRIAAAVGILPHLLPEVAKLVGYTLSEPFTRDAWLHTLATIERLSMITLSISPRRTDATAAVFDLGMLVVQLDRYRAQLNRYINQTWPNDRLNRNLLMLAALQHATGVLETPGDKMPVAASQRVAASTADRLKLSTAEKKHLIAVIRAAGDFLATQDWSPVMQHRYWFRYDQAGIGGVLLGLGIYLAQVGTYLVQEAWLDLVERARLLIEAFSDRYETIVNPPLLVDGTRLMDALGLSGGPIVGELLTLIREAQISEVITTPEDALDYVRDYLEKR